MSVVRVAAVDLGTVSSRLALAKVEDGRIIALGKQTVITDLGRGVDATGKLAPDAIRHVLDACKGFAERIASFDPSCTCTTLTSAARDASNGDELLRGLSDLGLRPQVIPGELEARLTFFGVAHDFSGQRIAVADSGGGSTEIAVGSYAPDAVGGAQGSDALALEHVQSLNIGCRRVTDRFLHQVPPTAQEVAEASAWAAREFSGYWEQGSARSGAGLAGQGGSRPDRLVAVGGTVTTLVALVHELQTYDSHFVHLRDLTLSQVESSIQLMSALNTAEIAALPGVQAKRAPVLLGGALVIRALMQTGGYDRLTVSENSLLAGMAETLYEVCAGGPVTIGWVPEVSR